MRIVILDGHTLNPGDLDWGKLAEVSNAIEIYPRTSQQQLMDRAKDAEILITNKVILTGDVLNQLSRLKHIAVSATGYNVVDLQAAKSLGISVSNVPEYGTDEVAQHTFALILELYNHVGLHDRSVKSGEWSRIGDFSYWKAPVRSLMGKILGVVGYGKIGRKVALLGKAFGMQVCVTSRTPDSDNNKFKSLESLLAMGDVVTLHTPLTRETNHMINSKSLALMKPDAILINTSRGDLINEEDLALALNSGVIAGAGLDVVSCEPISEDNPLLHAKHCIITPHNAWAAFESRKRLMHTTINNVIQFVKGESVNIVSAP